MDKPSFLSLLLLSALALLFFYEPLYGTALSASTIIQVLGLGAFLLVCVSLLIGPVAILWPKAGLPLIASRRAVGLAAFVFAMAHGLLVLDLYMGWNAASLFAYPPLLLGLIALLLIVVLALTSSDWATQRLGARTWKLVQSTNYLVFVIAFAHFILKSRALPLFSSKSPHLLEGLLLLLGVATLVLQVAGFLTRRARAQAAAPHAPGPSTAPSAPAHPASAPLAQPAAPSTSPSAPAPAHPAASASDRPMMPAQPHAPGRPK